MDFLVQIRSLLDLEFADRGQNAVAKKARRALG